MALSSVCVYIWPGLISASGWLFSDVIITGNKDLDPYFNVDSEFCGSVCEYLDYATHCKLANICTSGRTVNGVVT